MADVVEKFCCKINTLLGETVSSVSSFCIGDLVPHFPLLFIFLKAIDIQKAFMDCAPLVSFPSGIRILEDYQGSLNDCKMPSTSHDPHHDTEML